MKITELPDFIETSPIHNNKEKISKIDFLESLLKNIENKKEIKDIINNSNITQEQKDKLFQKFVFKLENKSIPFKNKPLINKFTLKDKKHPLKENSLLISLIQNNHNQKEVIQKIKKIPKKQQLQIVNEIKILLKNFNNPHIQKIILTKEFKEAKNFEDILNISKKYKLNITKLTISQIKNSKSFNKTLKNPEILKNELLTFVIKQKFNINKHSSKKITIKNLNYSEKQISKQNFNIADLLNKTLKETDNNTNIKISKNFPKIKKLKNNLNITDLLNKKNEKTDKDKILKKTTKHNDDNNFINNPISNTTLKHQIITAKQTLTHFVSSLKEAVENYKPPISKLTLELHPKELGKVEVTIKQRGDNLNVQINTNNISTVNFLTSTQQELKNSLINMGFSNINMSFNSNENNQQKQNQQQKHSKNNPKNEDEELIIDFSYKYA